MKWLLLVVLLVAAAGAYYYLRVYEPVRYTSNEVYLTRYASVMIPGGGVYGFPPGTKLTIDASRHPVPGRIFVTDGVHQLAVEPDALTRNPHLAEEAASEDSQVQAQAVAGAAVAKAHVAKAEADAQANRAQDIERLNAKQNGRVYVPTPTPRPTAFPPVR